MRGTLRERHGHQDRAGIIPAYAGNTCHAVRQPSLWWDHPRVCGEHDSNAQGNLQQPGSSPRMRGTPLVSDVYAEWMEDHPRVCGEHTCLRVRVLRIVGSSPRMRGTLDRHQRVGQVQGIIPAYAGNTSACMRVTGRVRDHPRVSGEHNGNPSAVTFVSGSSPRMRGTPADIAGSDHKTGIIPAYAGNTRLPNRMPGPRRDHPRVCGEHSVRISPLPMCTGSSPRMRGTLLFDFDGLLVWGIIPAYAGNTVAAPVRPGHWWDHPRVCGEHHSSSMFLLESSGSSPRMRGTPFALCRRNEHAGIIPAYAGNTTTTSASSLLCRDHPRVCGEHRLVVDFLQFGEGSSPRMRGTHLQHGLHVEHVGIIPAYAGNTWRATPTRTPHWDHPRVCGEHDLRSRTHDMDTGSSPRMRGTPLTWVIGAVSTGIIPAYAGNTFSPAHFVSSL